MQDSLELAKGLQHSNIPEVVQIAKALIELHKEFEELRQDYIEVVGENVMIRHEKLFKKLVENGD